MTKFCISEFGNLERHLAKAKELSLGFEIQTFCDPQQLDNRQNVLPSLKAKLAGLPSLSIHGSFSDLAPASRDPLIVEATRLRFRQAHEVAVALGAQRVVLHSGFMPKTYAPDVWHKNTVAFWQNFLRDIKDDIHFHIENVYEDDPGILARLIDALNTPQVSVCLDVGHVNANSTRPIQEWTEMLNDRIRHVHLHNNGGICDDHSGLSDGTLNMKDVMELLSKHSPQATWSLETRDLEGSLKWLEAHKIQIA
ncbi:MAG TPA: hypothetical protein DCZ95_14470 [Verrucomicrobia bacterium]|nr:MAG: hypothetical protein A2X46_07110 [Lentisphaerae bacterium GWF2_57_35]HBA85288.1 hypothetical protein [Verrucomicrobiota bacterium]